MKVEPQRLLERIRREDPEGARLIDDLLHRLPDLSRQADRLGELPEQFWRNLPLGILNRVNIPVEFGGLALTSTALRRVVVFEQVGQACPALPIGMPGPGLSMPPVLSLGTPEQKTEYFRRFQTDNRPVWGAFAITEPAVGSDATAIRTTATDDGDGYVINGEKCFITNGARADVVVVFASLNRDKGRFGIRAFVVPRETPGFSVIRLENMMGLRVSQLASLSFDNCKVSKDQMLGHNGKRGPLIDAFTGAQSAWDYMRPVLSALINGSSLGILAYAERLLNEGVVPISRSAIHTIREEIALYKEKVRSAQLIVYRAAWKYDTGDRSSLDASMAKAYSSSLAMEIANRLCTAFSLNGVLTGSRFEKFYRDAKAFDILEGTGDMHRLMIARAYQAAA